MMKLMRKASALLAIALIPACASYEITRGNPFDDLADAEKNVAIRIVQPADGGYGGKPTAGSGQLVARRIEEAASQKFRDVAITNAPIASATGRTLEIVPRLDNWEDRATNWSGISDKLRIKLRLRDLPSGQSRVVTYSAESSWFTFVNNPPQDLLNSEFDGAVDELLPTPQRGDQ